MDYTNFENINLENIWPNWHIESVIGTGAFGSVYLAKKSGYGPESDFYSAVKVIHVPANTSEIESMMADGASVNEAAAYYDGVMRQLVGEIELMETLKGCSNIVAIEDYEVRKNRDGISWTIFIRMELLKNLTKYRSEHAMGPEEVARLGIDICSALEYCQRKNIVHRDIKQDNIFVNEAGEFKLGDFGIARHLQKAGAHLSRKGTGAYMAPEIYRGEPYNGSVDIYSLGIVLYRLMNKGRLPLMPPYPVSITYEDTENAIRRRMSGELLPPPCACDSGLAGIILRACDADRQRRYQRPEQMKADLMAWKNRRMGAPHPARFASGNSQGGNYPPKGNTPAQAKGAQKSSESKKGSGILVKVCAGLACALVLFLVIFFLVPVGHGETMFNKAMYSMSGPSSRFNTAMKKGDAAFEDEDYDEALYFYKKRALKENSESLRAWIGVLKVHASDKTSSGDKVKANMLADLKSIGAIKAQPDTADAYEIAKAVNLYMDEKGNAVKKKILSSSADEAMAQTEAFFAEYDEFSEACSWKVDCSIDNAGMYAAIYDSLITVKGCEQYSVELLKTALKKYPDSEEIALRRADMDQMQAALTNADIEAALSEGDFKKAYELAKQCRDSLTEEEYKQLYDSIAFIEERTDFMSRLKTMLEAGNYDSIAKAIYQDSEEGFTKMYLQDGILCTNVESGDALIYDSNGLYSGDVKDGKRKGKGFQLKFYADGSYVLLSGEWDGNANGMCTYTWWASDGTEAVVTGNFTDGYEDGTMNIRWHQDGRDWSAAYSADMGTYKEIKKDTDGSSIYVIAYDDEGNSAWWSTNSLEGNGCFIR